MSSICGWVGPADPGTLDAMLQAAEYRGDTSETWSEGPAALGYRSWRGRPGKSPGLFHDGTTHVACAGAMAPAVPSPAAALPQAVRAGLGTLDGAFAGAWWDAEREVLTLVRDPFGVRSLYYVQHKGTLYFASELKQLLAIPDLPVVASPSVIHKYLTFSFVPGEDVPIEGIRRLLPGHVAVYEKGRLRSEPYFELRETIDRRFEDRATAVKHIRHHFRDAVRRRLFGKESTAVYLSGGLDSSAVALYLQREGASPRVFSLDFGSSGGERPHAELVARHLGLDLALVPVDGGVLAECLMELVWRLDVPFGDPVTGPQYLLGRAAREAGASCVFNGEGGDQLFGGWTAKPMLAAAVYGDMFGPDSREEMYLRSYHRFYGREGLLYTPDFASQVGPVGQRRALLAAYLGNPEVATFLNRVRLADIGLKGSQNILPRAERMTGAWGLDVRVPLFDRALTEASFSLPPGMKLHGATEKYVFKRMLRRDLPAETVWRKKSGMSVPITEWLLGSPAGASPASAQARGLSAIVDELLGPASLQSRGWFTGDYVRLLRQGRDEADETRRRRVGERLWTLLMLEAWTRVFVDGRGRRPA